LRAGARVALTLRGFCFVGGALTITPHTVKFLYIYSTDGTDLFLSHFLNFSFFLLSLRTLKLDQSARIRLIHSPFTACAGQIRSPLQTFVGADLFFFYTSVKFLCKSGRRWDLSLKENSGNTANKYGRTFAYY